MDKMLGIADDVYANVPYYLTDRDYERIDSLLSDSTYVESQIRRTSNFCYSHHRMC